MQLCGSIIIICWATQRHKTHTQREWKKEPAESERQRERRRDEESTFCICFVEKSNFICQKRILFIVSRVFEAHCLFYWCVFLFFFVFFPLLLHCMFSKTNVNLLKNCDMLQHALWAPAPHVCMSRVQTFVCLRKKNDSKCNAKMLARKKSRETERKQVR